MFRFAAQGGDLLVQIETRRGRWPALGLGRWFRARRRVRRRRNGRLVERHAHGLDLLHQGVELVVLRPAGFEGVNVGRNPSVPASMASAMAGVICHRCSRGPATGLP